MQKLKNYLKKFPRHWITTASGWVSKIIVALVQIISIRTLLFYLGEERYAVYIIAYSLVGWFAFANLSIGQSVQNFISQCRAKEMPYDKYLLSALQITIIAFLFSIALTAVIAAPIQTKLFVKFSNVAEISQVPIVLIVGLISLLYSFAGISYNIYFSLHKGYLPNIIPAIASILSMTLIVGFNRFHLHNGIMTALLIFILPQALLPLFPFIKIFKNSFKKLFDFDFAIVKDVLIRGVKLHGIACMLAIYGMTDYLIMSRTTSANEIVSYSIFMRIFSNAFFMYTALIAAIYPVIAEQFVKKEFSEIKRRLKKYVYYGFILIFTALVGCLLFRDLIINILAPNVDNIEKSFVFLSLIAIAMFLRVFLTAGIAFLTSINAVRFLWKYFPIMLILNIAFQYYFSKIYGIKGILIGFILSITLSVLWSLPLEIKKILKENKNINSKY